MHVFFSFVFLKSVVDFTFHKGTGHSMLRAESSRTMLASDLHGK